MREGLEASTHPKLRKWLALQKCLAGHLGLLALKSASHRQRRFTSAHPTQCGQASFQIYFLSMFCSTIRCLSCGRPVVPRVLHALWRPTGTNFLCAARHRYQEIPDGDSASRAAASGTPKKMGFERERNCVHVLGKVHSQEEADRFRPCNQKGCERQSPH